MDDNDCLTERSAEERLPIDVAARRAAREVLANFKRRAEALGMTCEEACAEVRRELDERIKMRKSGQEPPRITPCEG